MKGKTLGFRFSALFSAAVLFACLATVSSPHSSPAWSADVPVPLLERGHPVDWWFDFKFTSTVFRGCGAGSGKRACLFGGTVQTDKPFGQQCVYASSEHRSLTKGKGCAGTTTSDPVGTTIWPIAEFAL